MKYFLICIATSTTYAQNIELGPRRLLVAGAAAHGSPLVTLERAALVDAP